MFCDDLQQVLTCEIVTRFQIDNLHITRVATPEELAALTVSTGSSAANALQPLFDQLDNPEDPDNAPMASLTDTGSLDSAWTQDDGIDALSGGGLTPDPLVLL